MGRRRTWPGRTTTSSTATSATFFPEASRTSKRPESFWAAFPVFWYCRAKRKGSWGPLGALGTMPVMRPEETRGGTFT